MKPRDEQFEYYCNESYMQQENLDAKQRANGDLLIHGDIFESPNEGEGHRRDLQQQNCH